MWASLWAFLRPYLAAVVLTVVGVAFLLGWVIDGDGGVAAGAALLAAGFTHGVDVQRQQQVDATRSAADELDRRRRDLDETRRLLYLLMVRKPNSAPEVEATVLNALVHHTMAIPYDDVADHLFGPFPDGEWIRRLIREIGRELDALSTESKGKVSRPRRGSGAVAADPGGPVPQSTSEA